MFTIIYIALAAIAAVVCLVLFVCNLLREDTKA